MKFSDAMAVLESGKKVRCEKWHPDAFISRERMVFTLDRNDVEDDWELFEEPEQLLSFADVVKGLKEGKKFRRKDWPEGEFIKNFAPCVTSGNRMAGDFLFELEDFEAEDWIECK